MAGFVPGGLTPVPTPSPGPGGMRPPSALRVATGGISAVALIASSGAGAGGGMPGTPTVGTNAEGSLYHQCASVLERLGAIPSFAGYLEYAANAISSASNGQSAVVSVPVLAGTSLIGDMAKGDPVTLLWTTLRVGEPLAFLYNMALPDHAVDLASGKHATQAGQFPPPEKGGKHTTPSPMFLTAALGTLNSMKAQVYHSIVGMRTHHAALGLNVDADLFTIGELYQDDTSGFLKVLKTLRLVLERLERMGRIPPASQLPAHVEPMSATTLMRRRSTLTARRSAAGSSRPSMASSDELAGDAASTYSAEFGALAAAATAAAAAAAGDDPNSNGGAHRDESGGDEASPADTVALQSPAALTHRERVLIEVLQTERKYVTDLERLQEYMQHLATNSVLQPAVHSAIFSNLKALVDFQRRFLVGLETILVSAASGDERIGVLFVSLEPMFASVYCLFCANFKQASETAVEYAGQLQVAAAVMEPTHELPSYLIKPIQRICRYPLLLKELLKHTPRDQYGELVDDLTDGFEAIKRVVDAVNEARRMHENLLVKEDLERRVEDWKGHDVNTFGNLLLHDKFVMMIQDYERELVIFLFEKIILCCKETVAAKSSTSTAATLLKRKSRRATNAQAAGDDLVYQIKGRIWIGGITDLNGGEVDGNWLLTVSWTSLTKVEFFTLKCRNDEQFRQWIAAIQKCVDDSRERSRLRAQSRQQQQVQQQMQYQQQQQQLQYQQQQQIQQQQQQQMQYQQQQQQMQYQRQQHLYQSAAAAPGTPTMPFVQLPAYTTIPASAPGSYADDGTPLGDDDDDARSFIAADEDDEYHRQQQHAYQQRYNNNNDPGYYDQQPPLAYRPPPHYNDPNAARHAMFRSQSTQGLDAHMAELALHARGEEVPQDMYERRERDRDRDRDRAYAPPPLQRFASAPPNQQPPFDTPLRTGSADIHGGRPPAPHPPPTGPLPPPGTRPSRSQSRDPLRRRAPSVPRMMARPPPTLPPPDASLPPIPQPRAAAPQGPLPPPPGSQSSSAASSPAVGNGAARDSAESTTPPVFPPPPGKRRSSLASINVGAGAGRPGLRGAPSPGGLHPPVSPGTGFIGGPSPPPPAPVGLPPPPPVPSLPAASLPPPPPRIRAAAVAVGAPDDDDDELFAGGGASEDDLGVSELGMSELSAGAPEYDPTLLLSPDGIPLRTVSRPISESIVSSHVSDAYDDGLPPPPRRSDSEVGMNPNAPVRGRARSDAARSDLSVYSRSDLSMGAERGTPTPSTVSIPEHPAMAAARERSRSRSRSRARSRSRSRSRAPMAVSATAAPGDDDSELPPEMPNPDEIPAVVAAAVSAGSVVGIVVEEPAAAPEPEPEVQAEEPEPVAPAPAQPAQDEVPRTPTPTQRHTYSAGSGSSSLTPNAATGSFPSRHVSLGPPAATPLPPMPAPSTPPPGARSSHAPQQLALNTASPLRPSSSSSPRSPYRTVPSSPSVPTGTTSTNPLTVEVVKCRVYHGGHVYVLLLPRGVSSAGLVAQVKRKIGRPAGSEVRIKYEDDEGDFVLLQDDADVNLAMDTAWLHARKTASAAQSLASSPAVLNLFVFDV
ncbi:Guanine nucleotide exchange factor for Cdc42p [Blastocladiella emersonii ATCC 22665]|nr:Guanine nucleotide exchange factor for Cdc42p [Blastocladiella emersonii ATCC 22665]